jgi:hypothetical protein
MIEMATTAFAAGKPQLTSTTTTMTGCVSQTYGTLSLIIKLRKTYLPSLDKHLDAHFDGELKKHFYELSSDWSADEKGFYRLCFGSSFSFSSSSPDRSG